MLGGIERDVTVMFADIRGFTQFSQNLSAQEVVRDLNEILCIMVDCVFENEGTLDKFIGDAILVLFNAPTDQPDHVDRAARTALRIQERLKDHSTGLRVGIGLHRGLAVVGNIGTPKRMEYTAIGSTVNIASRLCDVARSGEVVLSATVADALSDTSITTTAREQVQLKGINQPITIARLERP